MKLAPQRRMDAVAGDHQRAFGPFVRVARAAQGDANPRSEVFGRDARAAGDDAIGADPVAHGVEQHRLQVAAVNRELRRVVAGPAPGRLAVDVLAEAIEERRLARQHRDLLERLEHAERLQRTRCVGQDIDADPERADLGRGFEHPAGDARTVQRERQRQAADAGADDQDLGVAAPRGRGAHGWSSRHLSARRRSRCSATSSSAPARRTPRRSR